MLLRGDVVFGVKIKSLAGECEVEAGRYLVQRPKYNLTPANSQTTQRGNALKHKGSARHEVLKHVESHRCPLLQVP